MCTPVSLPSGSLVSLTEGQGSSQRQAALSISPLPLPSAPCSSLPVSPCLCPALSPSPSPSPLSLGVTQPFLTSPSSRRWSWLPGVGSPRKLHLPLSLRCSLCSCALSAFPLLKLLLLPHVHSFLPGPKRHKSWVR